MSFVPPEVGFAKTAPSTRSCDGRADRRPKRVRPPFGPLGHRGQSKRAAAVTLHRDIKRVTPTDDKQTNASGHRPQRQAARHKRWVATCFYLYGHQTNVDRIV